VVPDFSVKCEIEILQGNYNGHSVTLQSITSFGST
jgi:hypothetical protein